MIQLRSATAADRDRIAALDAAAFGTRAWSQSTVESEFAQLGLSRVIVLAYDGEAVVGFAVLSLAVDACDVHRIAVVASHRRRGVATKLMVRSLELAAEAGSSRMLLEVAADNAAALMLYERQGFVEIARRPRYYDGPLDAVVMQRPLVTAI